jgi:hypothetical protein
MNCNFRFAIKGFAASALLMAPLANAARRDRRDDRKLSHFGSSRQGVRGHAPANLPALSPESLRPLVQRCLHRQEHATARLGPE